MLNTVKLLENRIQEYNALKHKSLQIDWKLLQEILCLLGELILNVAPELPASLQWLKSILLLIGELLKSVCSNVKPYDIKE